MGTPRANRFGGFNTANGNEALSSNTTGDGNTATGNGALARSRTGTDNIAVGDGAGSDLKTGSNNIYIDNQGVAGEANRIRIGNQGTQTATLLPASVGQLFRQV
jgi:hypothetical protein